MQTAVEVMQGSADEVAATGSTKALSAKAPSSSSDPAESLAASRLHLADVSNPGGPIQSSASVKQARVDRPSELAPAEVKIVLLDHDVKQQIRSDRPAARPMMNASLPSGQHLVQILRDHVQGIHDHMKEIHDVRNTRGTYVQHWCLHDC